MRPQLEQAEMVNALKQPTVLEEQPLCVSASDDLGAFLDTENEAFVGYDDRGLVIYRPYDNSGIYKVDMKTGGKEQIADLTEEQSVYERGDLFVALGGLGRKRKC